MSDDPWSSNRMSVTVKVPESKKWAGDNPWFVFEGKPEAIKANIIQTFGLSEESQELDLASVVINAQQVASSLGNASHELGANVISLDDKKKAKANGDSQDQTHDAWAKAKTKKSSKKEEKEDVDPILAAIEQAQTVDEVKQVWAENQKAFKDNPDYMDAYKARGKALKKG